VLDEYYEWIKAIHVIFMTAWMVGMFYLPRLYVYHADAKVGSDKDKVFQVMEYKLLNIIMAPASVITIFTGVLLASIYGWDAFGPWFHVKVFSVVALVWMHIFLARRRVDFSRGNNKRKAIFYRVFNELVTVAFVIIVIMVIVKPFEE
jgi:protoporphyrinogen IX oxidase